MVAVSWCFVREDIPVKFLSSEENPIEAFSLNLIFTKRNGLCVVLTPRQI